jgi:hypothetical protein
MIVCPAGYSRIHRGLRSEFDETRNWEELGLSDLQTLHLALGPGTEHDQFFSDLSLHGRPLLDGDVDSFPEADTSVHYELTCLAGIYKLRLKMLEELQTAISTFGS